MQEHKICPDLSEKGVQRLKENKSTREGAGRERERELYSFVKFLTSCSQTSYGDKATQSLKD